MPKRQACQTPTSHQTVSRQPLAAMTPNAQRAWIVATRIALVRKMHRERAYLDRRAARQTHTPTDDAYEADQWLEADLLALLDELAQALGEVSP